MWPLSLLSLLSAPAKIIKFVFEYWRQVSIVLMISLILHQNFMELELLKWVGIRTVPGITQDYNEAVKLKQDQLTACESSNAKLKDAISSQNTEIDEWVNVSVELQKRHDDVVVELEEMRKQTEQTIQEILSEPPPKSCEAAIDYLKSSAKDLKWKK